MGLVTGFDRVTNTRLEGCASPRAAEPVQAIAGEGLGLPPSASNSTPPRAQTPQISGANQSTKLGTPARRPRRLPSRRPTLLPTAPLHAAPRRPETKAPTNIPSPAKLLRATCSFLCFCLTPLQGLRSSGRATAAFKPTRSGRPLQAFISFSALRALSPRAAQLKR